VPDLPILQSPQGNGDPGSLEYVGCLSLAKLIVGAPPFKILNCLNKSGHTRNKDS
jgi:hypothetical protein